MTIATELAALRALARRLSEPWPAEERAAKAVAIHQGVLALRRGDPGKRQSEIYEDVARSAPHGRLAAEGYWRLNVWHEAKDRRATGTRVQHQTAYLRCIETVGGTRYPRSWMPSIARVGPIVFRWPAETVTPEPEEWRTYEAIRRCARVVSGGRAYVDAERLLGRRHDWSPDMRAVIEASNAEESDMIARLGQVISLDAFSLGVAQRLAPQPIHLPAVVQHIGAQPRDWRSTRLRRRWRRGGRAPHVPMRHSNRATLGTLAAHYTPRRPDGSYNRHDARRWMRAFRAVASVAGDAIERWGLAGRTRAIAVLLKMVGLDDAVRLTERPGPARTLADYVNVTVTRTAVQSASWRSYAAIRSGMRLDRDRVDITTWSNTVPSSHMDEANAAAQNALDSVPLLPATEQGLDVFAHAIHEHLRGGAGLDRQPMPYDQYPWLTATGAELDAVAARVGLRRLRGMTGPEATPWGDEPDAALRERVARAALP